MAHSHRSTRYNEIPTSTCVNRQYHLRSSARFELAAKPRRELVHCRPFLCPRATLHRGAARQIGYGFFHSGKATAAGTATHSRWCSVTTAGASAGRSRRRRTLAKDNAIIGIGYGAFFPNVSLSETGGFDSSTFSQWSAWPSRFFSIVPSISQTILNGDCIGPSYISTRLFTMRTSRAIARRCSRHFSRWRTSWLLSVTPRKLSVSRKR